MKKWFLEVVEITSLHRVKNQNFPLKTITMTVNLSVKEIKENSHLNQIKNLYRKK